MARGQLEGGGWGEPVFLFPILTSVSDISLLRLKRFFPLLSPHLVRTEAPRWHTQTAFMGMITPSHRRSIIPPPPNLHTRVFQIARGNLPTRFLCGSCLPSNTISWIKYLYTSPRYSTLFIHSPHNSSAFLHYSSLFHSHYSTRMCITCLNCNGIFFRCI